MVDDNTVLCITETHQKHRTVTIPDMYSFIDQMREVTDKKGGGLMIVHKKSKHITVTKQATNHQDILAAEIKYKNFTGKILLIYGPTNDKDRYIKILREIETHIDQEGENSNNLILGDFNAHLGFLGPQKINIEGKKILDLMEKKGLILLNNDPNCMGEITWEGRDQTSAIDFIFASQSMHQKFTCMEIDDAKQHYDLSDHNLLTATFEIQTNHKNEKPSKNKINFFYSTKEECLRKFGQRVETILQGQNTCTLEKLEETMLTVAEDDLRKTFKRPTYAKGRNMNAPWYNKKIDESIKQRRSLNRKARNETKAEMKEQYLNEYKKKKSEVQRLVRLAKTEHEKETIKSIRSEKDTKKLWKHIKKLQNYGKNENNQEIRVYNEDNAILQKEEIGEKLSDYWRNIYQKHDNQIEQVWNEEQEEEYRIRYQEEIEAERRVANSGGNIILPEILREHYDCTIILEEPSMVPMNNPQITATDLEKQIKKMKSGKAAGPNGLKIEMFKEILNHQEIKYKLVNAYNEIIQNKRRPESWRISNTKLLPKKKKKQDQRLQTDSSFKHIIQNLHGHYQGQVRSTPHQ